MDKEERQQRLERMRAAVKEARREREEARAYLTHYLNISTPCETVDQVETAAGVVKEARARNLLKLGKCDNERGEPSHFERLSIKESEDYKNRPSVRALKQSRSNEPEP